MQRRQHAMQFSCRPHHRSVLARNLPCRVVAALFRSLLSHPSCHPFSQPSFPLQREFLAFPDPISAICVRDIYVCIYIYVSVFKTGKWQNSGNSGATSVFCKISRGTKLSGMAITRSLGREIRRISSTFACSLSRRDIKSYLRLRYVR